MKQKLIKIVRVEVSLFLYSVKVGPNRRELARLARFPESRAAVLSLNSYSKLCGVNFVNRFGSQSLMRSDSERAFLL